MAKEGTASPPGKWWQSQPAAWGMIALVVAALVLPSLDRPKMLHDSFWIDRVWVSQFTALLREGVAYPRWLPWSHEGLGSPVFYYYPPLAFYVTGIFGLAGLSTYGSIIATFALAFLVSGLGAYHWLHGRTRHPLLGALFFTAAPYHTFDFYTRGALAESVAIALLPLLAIGLRRIAEGRSWTLAAGIYAATILTHLPLALLISVFFIAPYALIHRGRLASFVLAVVVGIGLASIYLLPAFALEPYRDIAQLWAMRQWRPSYWSVFVADWRSYYVAHVYLVTATLTVAALIPSVAARDRWAFYGLAILALAFGLIPFVWSLPLLRDVQFPYRILPMAELAIAAAVAGAQLSMIKRVSAMLLPLAWSMTLTQLQPGTSARREAQIARHIDVTEFLPPGVQGPGPRVPMLEEPKAGRIPPPIVEGWVVRPTFYFPAWSCGHPEPQTKLLMHRPGCDPEIRLTIYEKIGGLISLFFLLILLLGRPIAKRLHLTGKRSQPRPQVV